MVAGGGGQHMHGDVTRDGAVGPAPRTPAAAILAFRNQYCLTSERLAALLDVEPETLRQYEVAGSAPPWVAYALKGVAYEQFGAGHDADGADDEATLPVRVTSPLMPPASAESGGAERVPNVRASLPTNA